MPASGGININHGSVKLSEIMPQAKVETTTQNEQTTTQNEDLVITDKDDIDDLVDEIPPEMQKQINKLPNPDENPEEKQNLIFKIQKYQDSELFGETVKKHLGFNQGYDELNDRSINDLENMLSRIRIHLDNKNLDKFYERTAESAAMLYEGVVSTVYDIDGFSDLLLDSDDFWNIYERFKIENNFPAVNPAVQLTFIIGQCTFMAHHLAGKDDGSLTMEGPPPLETIIEEIEEDFTPSPSPEPQPIVKNEKTDTAEKTQYIVKPVSLGGSI